MTSPRLLLTLSLTFAAACASRASAPSAPGTAAVVLSEDEAPAGYVELAPLSVQSGKGCGVFGSAGSRDEANAKLRSEASKLGATYVRITRVEEPRPNHECMEHEYKLSGTAYRGATPPPIPGVPSGSPAATPATTSAPPASAPAPSAMPAPTAAQPPEPVADAVP